MSGKSAGGGGGGGGGGAVPPKPPHKHGGLKPGQAAAIGLVGGLLLGTLANQRSAQPAPGFSAKHYADCGKKYNSYVAATDSYRGFDGMWHRCRLP